MFMNWVAIKNGEFVIKIEDGSKITILLFWSYFYNYSTIEFYLKTWFNSQLHPWHLGIMLY